MQVAVDSSASPDSIGATADMVSRSRPLIRVREAIQGTNRQRIMQMFRIAMALIIGVTLSSVSSAQTMTLTTSNSDYQVTNVFSDVGVFTITVVIDTPLAAGVYNNPDIINVNYQVSGTLAQGTPSGFPAFALSRDISGTEFYAQGSSLSFQISPSAVLDDGVQVAELVGSGVVLTYNAREVGNGRFHPALFELSANGTGRIQNSDNIVSENPFQQVNFGEEYITDLVFDPGNTTVISGVVPNVPRGGSGATSRFDIVGLLTLGLFVSGLRYRRRIRAGS
jgi:hypothetical protein